VTPSTLAGSGPKFAPKSRTTPPPATLRLPDALAPKTTGGSAVVVGAVDPWPSTVTCHVWPVPVAATVSHAIAPCAWAGKG